MGAELRALMEERAGSLIPLSHLLSLRLAG